ncbi:MAG: glycosyltransferase [Rhodothermales bacterium]|nr:glycosyltransferase [Rhodothermales bacterium]
MNALLVAPLAAYALLALVATMGLLRRRVLVGNNGIEKRSVVVVAARNEVRSIERCVAALLAQTPPLRAVVVADDGSTDGTGDHVRERFGESVTVLDVPQDDASPLRGKARALAFATAHVRLHHPNALLLFTDADCTPPSGWANALASALAALRRPGVLGAGAFVRPTRSFAAAQTLDWALGAGVAAGMSGLGWTASAMGNNLAASPEAYDAVGGFEGVGASVTEDHALVQAATKAGFDTAYVLHPASTVVTEAVPTFGALLRQRQRWAVGGLRGGPAVWALYTVVATAHAALVAALFTGAWAVAGVKIAADALVLLGAQRGLGRRLPWAWFGLFEVVLTAYVLATPFGLLRPVVWKGQRL